MTEDEATALDGPEDIGSSPEPAALYPFKQQGGSAGCVHPKVYGGHLQVRVHFLPDPDQLTITFQVQQACFERWVRHATKVQRAVREISIVHFRVMI